MWFVIIEIALDRGLQGAVVPFHLSIRLWVVGRSELVIHVQDLTHALEEIRGEALAIIC